MGLRGRKVGEQIDIFHSKHCWFCKNKSEIDFQKKCKFYPFKKIIQIVETVFLTLTPDWTKFCLFSDRNESINLLSKIEGILGFRR
jgi:hypothetical protein